MQNSKIAEKVVWENGIPDDDAAGSFMSPGGYSLSQMMFCWKCGQPIPGNSKYCPYCQIRLYVKCPKCDIEYSSQYPSCNQCGTNRESYLLEQERQKQLKEQLRLQKEKEEKELQERERQIQEELRKKQEEQERIRREQQERERRVELEKKKLREQEELRKKREVEERIRPIKERLVNEDKEIIIKYEYKEACRIFASFSKLRKLEIVLTFMFASSPFIIVMILGPLGVIKIDEDLWGYLFLVSIPIMLIGSVLTRYLDRHGLFFLLNVKLCGVYGSVERVLKGAIFLSKDYSDLLYSKKFGPCGESVYFDNKKLETFMILAYRYAYNKDYELYKGLMYENKDMQDVIQQYLSIKKESISLPNGVVIYRVEQAWHDKILGCQWYETADGRRITKEYSKVKYLDYGYTAEFKNGKWGVGRFIKNTDGEIVVQGYTDFVFEDVYPFKPSLRKELFGGYVAKVIRNGKEFFLGGDAKLYSQNSNNEYALVNR